VSQRPKLRKKQPVKRREPAKKPLRKTKKSPVKSPVMKPGQLVHQPHGGALRSGSQPGTNAGGTGRPPSQIRAAYAQSFDKRLYIYESIADNKRGKPSDRLAAMDSMGKFGLGSSPVEFADIRQHPDAIRFMAAYRQALTLELSVEMADRVTAKVDELLMVASET
jgi:hypothetical protein